MTAASSETVTTAGPARMIGASPSAADRVLKVKSPLLAGPLLAASVDDTRKW